MTPKAERIARKRAQRVPEVRAVTGNWFAPYAGAGSQRIVNPILAENLTAISACVNAIAGGVATLPAYVYERDGDGRREVTDHPVMRLIRRGPNRWQSWPDFVETLLGQTLLTGNGLAEIKTNGRGEVIEIAPIPWTGVSVTLLPSGRLAYDVVDITSTFGQTGKIRRLLDDQVLHIKDRSADGFLGKSRLSSSYGAVSAALQTQTFADSMWSNATRPSGVLTYDHDLSPEALTALRENFSALYTGTDAAARVMILDNGVKFTGLSMSAEDAQLLLSRRFGVEEMARLYGVPPLLIGDLTNSSFNNAETMMRFFAQGSLRQWIRKIEAEFCRKALNDGEVLEIDLSGLLRGDPESRWKSHQIAVTAGILTPNEVRETEGYNPLEGGDDLKSSTTLPGTEAEPLGGTPSPVLN